MPTATMSSKRSGTSAGSAGTTRLGRSFAGRSLCQSASLLSCGWRVGQKSGSPAMERLRNITLAVSACEILLWLVIAVLNDREDPQALADVVSIMFVAMLPTNLAFVMSVLRRGPPTAAALAGLGLWMLLPQLTARIVPLS